MHVFMNSVSILFYWEEKSISSYIFVCFYVKAMKKIWSSLTEQMFLFAALPVIKLVHYFSDSLEQ